MKKTLSLLLALAILLGIAPLSAGAATPVKEGYTLVPTMYTRTGVDVQSAFVLTTPSDASADEIAASLSIDGQPAPGVAQRGAREFAITPALALSQNSLYVFRLAREGKADVTWAFQTAKKFQVTSNYPQDAATNVPRNSGIEITFSEEGYTPIDKYFSISPHVEGRFEYHKETAVFVPRGLDYRTVYTVTLKAGVKIEGSSEQLLTDYVFEFETEAERTYKPSTKKYHESVYFYSWYLELPSIEAPNVGFRISHSSGTPMPDPKISVYKFSSVDKAVAAVKKLQNSPRWAQYALEGDYLEGIGLSKVMSFGGKDCYDENMGNLTLPGKLSQGFYLISAELSGSRDQMIVQISDLPVQVIADDGKALVWVNDISTGKASASATVRDIKGGRDYSTDSNGIAVIDRMLEANGSEQLTVTSTSGKTCVWLYSPDYSYYYGRYGYYSYSTGGNEAYWTVLQLDRTLFLRDDTVSFFGFVQNRDKSNEDLRNVTAVLTRGFRYGRYGSRDTLLKQVVPVENGAYSDEIRLPNLEAGNYCLTIYHGEIELRSMYFDVEEYVKPQYKIEVGADKKAAFAGETATFSAFAGFFEGTPVSKLDVSYSLFGYMLMAEGNGRGMTDIDGKIEVAQKIVPHEGTQGETYLYFMVEATLPEIGRTTKDTQVRVFINDIDVRARATRTKGKATLAVDVNSITLDRINDGTALHYFDYIDAPVARKPLSVEIYRVYYEKTEAGEHYDYIQKRLVKHYSYERREEAIDRFEMVTDSAGAAAKEFSVPNRDCESYFARITCVDGNGRSMTQHVYIGRDYSQYYSRANTNEYYLDGAMDCYDVGEEVSLTLMRGADAVTRGSFLFVAAQRGIQNYKAGANPYTFRFARQHVPNIVVFAYYFDGYKYQSTYYMSEDIRYDYSKSDLTLTATADKQVYKPGDMCSITVTARDNDGRAKEANINISVVDEALFALSDYSVDTITSLYHSLSPGLRFTMATHRSYSSGLAINSAPPPGGGAGSYYIDSPEAPLAMSDAVEESGDETYLREVFEDTAIFGAVRTDEDGVAIYTFKLPDNITSWRLTLSGVSNDLYAGNSVQNIVVTNPMFLTYSLNNVFLVGDVPTIGVNAYGTSLTGGETVTFEVWDEKAPDVKYTASGAAFERVNIPLWKMKDAGAYALVVKATVSNGTSDAVRHQYQVLDTYREIDEAVYYDVTASTVFKVGSGGLTNITFTDRSKGQFLYQLICMRYAGCGNRIERLLVQREADKLLKEHFPDLRLYYGEGKFDLGKYQRGDGGLAILPHADSDLETTVKLMPYVMDELNVSALRDYLYGIYEGDNAENKMCALYGLAMLREPVLRDLDNYSLLDSPSVKDAVYLALGYCALGEHYTASGLYDRHVAPNLERITPYYRVNTGVDNDDILVATAAANLLATMLEKPERDGLYQYCIRNHTTDVLINVERLSHIMGEITKRSSESGSITYTLFGEQHTRELKNGGSYTLSIPAQSIGGFKLLEVKGEVGAVSTYKKPMTDIGAVDKDITVRRRYYKVNGGDESTTTFEQGDLVRVQVWIDYSAKAINGSYSVTDFLPAGLSYVTGSAKIGGAPSFGYGYFRYCTTEGQKVTFYDYNGRFSKGYLYYYYARVISPGTFVAEGPFVQNLVAKEYYTVGEDSTIVIKG